MTVALKKRSNAELLEEVARLSERMTGEVVDGELYVMGRPTPGHQNVEGEVTGALRFGGGGRPPPVGWLILPEVEVRFSTLEQVFPDVAGWLRARLAGHEHENPVVVRPDWVCEILSDFTRQKDLGPKRELYAAHRSHTCGSSTPRPTSSRRSCWRGGRRRHRRRAFSRCGLRAHAVVAALSPALS